MAFSCFEVLRGLDFKNMLKKFGCFKKHSTMNVEFMEK